MINTTRYLPFLLVIPEEHINLKSARSQVSLALTFIHGDEEALFTAKSIPGIVVIPSD